MKLSCEMKKWKMTVGLAKFPFLGVMVIRGNVLLWFSMGHLRERMGVGAEAGGAALRLCLERVICWTIARTITGQTQAKTERTSFIFPHLLMS